MKNCLMVLDAQESLRQRAYFTERSLPARLAAQTALVAGCTEEQALARTDGGSA